MPPPGCPPLTENAVHVWHQRVDALNGDGIAELLRAYLSESERTRLAQIRREDDRLIYLVSRVMMRQILARYLGCGEEAIAFTANAFGKPTVATRDATLHFNLTHSRGVVALAVSATREVGIDVEERHRNVEYLLLAERFFAEPEARHLRGLEGDRLRDAFFAIWTLKEAFVKGIGRGLSFPLDAFCFELDEHRLVAFRPLADFVASDWRFHQFELGDRHFGALAVRDSSNGEVAIEFRDWGAEFQRR